MATGNAQIFEIREFESRSVFGRGERKNLCCFTGTGFAGVVGSKAKIDQFLNQVGKFFYLVARDGERCLEAVTLDDEITRFFLLAAFSSPGIDRVLVPITLPLDGFTT